MPHLSLVPFLLVAVIVALGLVITLMRRRADDATSTYVQRSLMFSAAERSFLGVLDLAVGKDYRVFGKVRVADVLAPTPTPSKAVWQAAFNKISAKHFDFVVCNARELSVTCVIELDDRSHQTTKRATRDQFLERICAQSGVPLLRWPVKADYAVDAVRVEFLKRVQKLPSPAVPSTISPPPAPTPPLRSETPPPTNPSILL